MNSLLLAYVAAGSSAFAATLSAEPVLPSSRIFVSNRSPCQTATFAVNIGVPFTFSCDNNCRAEKLRPLSLDSAKYTPGAFPSPAAYHTTFKFPDARSIASDGPDTGQPCSTQWSSLTITGCEKVVPPLFDAATAM